MCIFPKGKIINGSAIKRGGGKGIAIKKKISFFGTKNANNVLKQKNMQKHFCTWVSVKNIFKIFS